MLKKKNIPFPKRFEEEVLVKHDIKWSDNINWYVKYTNLDKFGEPYGVDRYELAGIALEAIKKPMRWFIPSQEWVMDESIDGYLATDKDFCTCIFKAVEEIWKD